MKKETKDNIKFVIVVTLFITLFFFLVLGPKPYWLPNGEMIWQ